MTIKEIHIFQSKTAYALYNVVVNLYGVKIHSGKRVITEDMMYDAIKLCKNSKFP